MIDIFDYSTPESIQTGLYIQHNCKLIISWMLNEQCSIRECADNLGVSKTYVHKMIHSYIKIYYDEEYLQILQILKYNKENKFKPRSRWRNTLIGVR